MPGVSGWRGPEQFDPLKINRFLLFSYFPKYRTRLVRSLGSFFYITLEPRDQIKPNIG